MISRISILALLLSALLTPSLSLAQQYPDQLLTQKSNFMRGAAQAMGEPFRGVTTPDGIVANLFPVKTTGVSTASLRAAAEAYLAGLDTVELSRSHFAIHDPEWRNWSNVDVGIFARHGLSLEEMSESQKNAAWNLLEASLSTAGIDKTRRIMRTEQTLLELNDEPIRYGEDKYYLTFMGTPSDSEPWGWQLDGHHLVINFFVMGDQVVMTPAFWGGEPVHAEAGMYAGNIILQEEQNRGLELMQSLSDGQRSSAILNPEKTRNNQLAAANQDNLVLPMEGIKGSELSSAQKLDLLNLIRVYIGNLREPHADITMSEIATHIDDTYFAWIGSVGDESVFYYRIHSPVILIEFDHQNPVGTLQKNTPGTPTRDHIHTMVRTPNGNDYGKDLLAQHLAAHPH